MNFEDQYYILMRPLHQAYPDLVADEATAARDYDFDPLPVFSNPVLFKNSAFFEHPDQDRKFLRPPLLKTATSFITIEAVKDYFEDFHDLKGMRFHPAVYVESDNETFPNYWYLNIYSDLDCWDRDKSDVDDFLGDGKPVHIDKYVLNSSILRAIDEEDRLIFRMGGGVAGSPLFVHQRIIDYFEEASVTGYRAFKVSEYEFGMEFRP